jgi:hypothetical protein
MTQHCFTEKLTGFIMTENRNLVRNYFKNTIVVCVNVFIFYINLDQSEKGLFLDCDDVTNYATLWETDPIASKLLNDGAMAAKKELFRLLAQKSTAEDDETKLLERIKAERSLYEACQSWKNLTRPTRMSVDQVRREILEIALSKSE